MYTIDKDTIVDWDLDLESATGFSLSRIVKQRRVLISLQALLMKGSCCLQLVL